MKKIELFDEAMADRDKGLKAYGLNWTLIKAYEAALNNGNELIDFYDVIWDYEITGIVKNCKENGIEEFTISSTFTGLIATIAEFEKNGFKMDGLTQTLTRYTSWRTGEYEHIPAIHMKYVA